MKAWWPSGEEEVCTLLCQTQLPDSHAALPVLQISHHHQAQFGSKRSSWSEQQFNIVHYNLKVKQRWKSWHVKTTNYFIYLFFLKGGGVEILTRTKTYSGCHLPSSATASEYHLPYFNLFYFIRPPRKLIFLKKSIIISITHFYSLWVLIVLIDFGSTGGVSSRSGSRDRASGGGKPTWLPPPTTPSRHPPPRQCETSNFLFDSAAV